MNAFPRAFVILAILCAAIVPVPMASAGACVDVDADTFSDTFRVIANTGNQIALGFRAPAPGDGVAFVVIITPSLCGGVGVGAGDLSGQSARDTLDDLAETAANAPSFLPLP